MFEKCIECEKLGKECHPNLYIMNMAEIRDFLRARKDFQGMTNADVAERSGIPKGTVDAFFSSSRRDVNYSTLSPILCALVGNSGEMPCSPPQAGQAEADAQLMDELRTRIAKQESLMKWKKQIIAFLAVIVCILLSVLLAAFIVDELNDNVGFININR